jgi:hypothetical protein
MEQPELEKKLIDILNDLNAGESPKKLAVRALVAIAEALLRTAKAIERME